MIFGGMMPFCCIRVNKFKRMKMNSTGKWVLLFSFSTLLLGISGCSKIMRDARDNITSAEDFAASETEVAGLFDVSDDAIETNFKSFVLPVGVKVKKLDTVSAINEYELDFGPKGNTEPMGILCADGRYRAGKIRISFTKPYSAIGGLATIKTSSIDPYYSGDGENMPQIVTDISIKRKASHTFEITLNGTQLIFSDGSTTSFHGIRNLTKISGQSTPGIWGDEYEVTGNGSGVNREDENYTWNITTPLLKRLQSGCARTFVKGVISIENEDAQNPLEVDFDPFNNAACDRTVKAIYGNRSVKFSVR